MNQRVERVDAERTRPLRLEVLRQGQPESSAVIPGDDDPRTAHFALRLETGGGKGPDRMAEEESGGDADVLASVGTVLADPPPWDPTLANAWRIRGMATKGDLRGRGYGRAVLDALVEHARSNNGEFIWCHARVGALDFYRRAGFTPIGEVFDDGIAIHQSMWRALP